MRGIVAVTLKVLGAILVAAAVIWPTYVVGMIVKFPAQEDASSTLRAVNASYFSPKTLRVQTGATVQVTLTIKTDPVHPGSSSTDVWDQSTVAEDVTNHVTIAKQSRTFAFNRSTAMLVACCGESINGDTSVRQTGYPGVLFPMNTGKQTYLVFDATLKRQMPYVYSGTVTVDGIAAYEFTENYGPTESGMTPFIGSLVGSSTAVPTLPEYSAAHAVLFVDPQTGAPLEINEHETTSVRNPANGDSVTVLDANLVTTPASLAAVVALDKSGRAQLRLVETTLPVGAGTAGAVSLIAGLVLGRKRRVPPALPGAGTGGRTMTPHRVIGRRYRGTRRRPRRAGRRGGTARPASALRR